MKPNIVFIFSDQHRSCDVSWLNPDVITPNLLSLKNDGIEFSSTVSNNPVCCPYRATLMTGQFSHTHGVFVNDVCLSNNAVSIADAFKEAGYNTGYIGKWHLDGHGRGNCIPPERRQGFDFFQGIECSHDYNDSKYYTNDGVAKFRDGYDAKGQTDATTDYIKNRNKEKPFILLLSWGPPHNPYEGAPDEFKQLYTTNDITLRPNVPNDKEMVAKTELAGYYAHISALDSYVGDILSTIKQEGIDENTIFIYTSDHGDMLHSHGYTRKQKPWDESILIPFIMRYKGIKKQITTPFGSADIMPTLLDLCGVEIPKTVQGKSYADAILTDKNIDVEGVLLECVHPFGEYCTDVGGKEYRGVRTMRYTYAKDLNGAWLLYDNQTDPYQMNNLCDNSKYTDVQIQLDVLLKKLMLESDDQFISGYEYIKKWGYTVDKTGTVPYF